MVISWQVGPARQAGEVKGVKPHRRLAASEAERGGGARDRVSDDQKAAETISEEPWLARIPWDTRETVGVPGLAGAELAAAAGARPRAGAALRCTGAAAESTGA